jgi:guanylate kinase
MPRGPLIVISGPAGVGKSTIVQRLLEDKTLPLWRSVSATTRPRRANEVPGRDYLFWSREEFDRAVAEAKFLEHARVHGSHDYGTPAEEVERHRARGEGVILVIDVHGFEQVRRKCRDVVSVFLYASAEDCEKRLQARGTEDPQEIRRRLETGQLELQRRGEYHYQLMNEDLDRTVARLRELIAAEFQRRRTETGGTECSTN